VIYSISSWRTSSLDLFDYSQKVKLTFTGKRLPPITVRGRAAAQNRDERRSRVLLPMTASAFKSANMADRAWSVKLMPHTAELVTSFALSRAMQTGQILEQRSDFFSRQGAISLQPPIYGSLDEFMALGQTIQEPTFLIILVFQKMPCRSPLNSKTLGKWNFYLQKYQECQFRSRQDPVLYSGIRKINDGKDRARNAQLPQSLNEATVWNTMVILRSAPESPNTRWPRMQTSVILKFGLCPTSLTGCMNFVWGREPSDPRYYAANCIFSQKAHRGRGIHIWSAVYHQGWIGSRKFYPME